MFHGKPVWIDEVENGFEKYPKNGIQGLQKHSNFTISQALKLFVFIDWIWPPKNVSYLTWKDKFRKAQAAGLFQVRVNCLQGDREKEIQVAALRRTSLERSLLHPWIRSICLIDPRIQFGIHNTSTNTTYQHINNISTNDILS